MSTAVLVGARELHVSNIGNALKAEGSAVLPSTMGLWTQLRGDRAAKLAVLFQDKRALLLRNVYIL